MLPNCPHPTIVELPRDTSINRFSPTYSVWENGDFWRTKVGSRKAYSSYDSAFAAVELVLFRRHYEVVEAATGLYMLRPKPRGNQ